jgi:hypothetical protein
MPAMRSVAFDQVYAAQASHGPAARSKETSSPKASALAGSPDERVLVIYGAGHLGWLRQMAASDESVELRTLAELVAQR